MIFHVKRLLLKIGMLKKINAFSFLSIKIYTQQTHIHTCIKYIIYIFRVVVEQILGSTMFLICYCDYGDIVMVNSDRLKMLPANFRTLPRLAISAKLYGNYIRLPFIITAFCIK